jgi:hypothetical protein
MNAHEQRETFDALIRQHSPAYPAKLKELLDLRDSIAEARKQGASYEIIRSYLRKTAILNPLVRKNILNFNRSTKMHQHGHDENNAPNQADHDRPTDPTPL